MPSTSGLEATRREALKKMLLVSAGICAGLLGASGFLAAFQHGIQQSRQGSVRAGTDAQSQPTSNVSTISSTSTSAISKSQFDGGAAAEYTINVKYFGFTMTQITGTSQEYLVLPAPVLLQDVIAQIEKEHVVLTPMLPLMAIIVNGMPADGNPQLANNSEVDLIPAYAGG
jgi:molybdopterin converting factor small subunit